MHSRILLALALAAPAPLALGQGTISPTPVPDDDIACPPGTSVTLALRDILTSSNTLQPWAEFSFDNNILGATLDLTWRDQGWGYIAGGPAASSRL